MVCYWDYARFPFLVSVDRVDIPRPTRHAFLLLSLQPAMLFDDFHWVCTFWEGELALHCLHICYYIYIQHLSKSTKYFWFAQALLKKYIFACC